MTQPLVKEMESEYPLSSTGREKWNSTTADELMLRSLVVAPKEIEEGEEPEEPVHTTTEPSLTRVSAPFSEGQESTAPDATTAAGLLLVMVQ